MAAIPMLVMGMGMARARPWIATVAGVAVLITSLLNLPERRARTHLQERNIARLHTEPAKYMAQELPADSVVIVEGAGASRFFAPRTMTIVDMLGLNFNEIVHAKGDLDRICAMYTRKPGYLLIPTRHKLSMRTAFQTEFIRNFDEPKYAQTSQTGPRRVVLFKITGLPIQYRRKNARICGGSEGYIITVASSIWRA